MQLECSGACILLWDVVVHKEYVSVSFCERTAAWLSIHTVQCKRRRIVVSDCDLVL